METTRDYIGELNSIYAGGIDTSPYFNEVPKIKEILDDIKLQIEKNKIDKNTLQQVIEYLKTVQLGNIGLVPELKEYEKEFALVLRDFNSEKGIINAKTGKELENETTNLEEEKEKDLKSLAYKLITGKNLKNNEEIIVEKNSKNETIYCLKDKNICKTEQEVIDFKNGKIESSSEIISENTYNFSTASKIGGNIENKEVRIGEKYKVEIVEEKSHLKIRNEAGDVIGKLKKGEIVEIVGKSIQLDSRNFVNIKIDNDKTGFVAAAYLVEKGEDGAEAGAEAGGGNTKKIANGTIIKNQTKNIIDGSIGEGDWKMNNGVLQLYNGTRTFKDGRVWHYKNGLPIKTSVINKNKIERVINAKDTSGIWNGEKINGKFSGTLKHNDGSGRVDIYKDGVKVDYNLEYMALMAAMVRIDVAGFTGIGTIPSLFVGTGYDIYDLTQKEDAGWQFLKKIGLVDNRYYAGNKGTLEYVLNVLGLVPGMTAALKGAQIAKYVKTLSAKDKVKFSKIESFIKDKFLGIGETAKKKNMATSVEFWKNPTTGATYTKNADGKFFNSRGEELKGKPKNIELQSETNVNANGTGTTSNLKSREVEFWKNPTTGATYTKNADGKFFNSRGKELKRKPKNIELQSETNVNANGTGTTSNLRNTEKSRENAEEMKKNSILKKMSVDNIFEKVKGRKWYNKIEGYGEEKIKVAIERLKSLILSGLVSGSIGVGVEVFFDDNGGTPSDLLLAFVKWAAIGMLFSGAGTVLKIGKELIWLTRKGTWETVKGIGKFIGKHKIIIGGAIIVIGTISYLAKADKTTE